MNRREFLRLAGLASVGAATSSSIWARAARAAARCSPNAVSGANYFGPLQPADANGLELPLGFRSRIVAQGGSVVAGTGHSWHVWADGGAVFPALPDTPDPGLPGGYIYVSNSEVGSGGGGVGALRFDWRGDIVDAYTICNGTSRNCAGGATPWGTWLTCEEVGAGRILECDPYGVVAAVYHSALGAGSYEAVAVDPKNRRLYITEDGGNNRFRRFTPTTWGDLSAGTLERMVDTGGAVSWVPDSGSNGTFFGGGEGCIYSRGKIFFTTKYDGRVWDYDPDSETLTTVYDDDTDLPTPQLTGVDNLAISRADDLLVAEDGGNMEIVMLTPECKASPIVRIVGQDGSEITGPALCPLGRRLYFSSQRGGAYGLGITYEIEGPFRRERGV